MLADPHKGLRTQHVKRLKIIPVEGRHAWRQFIHLPWSIYANNPVWVPPLLLERHQLISLRNPYFAHARWKAWLAFQGKRPVGRISAQVDQLYLDHHQNATGFFGMLEAEDESEVFSALLNAAGTWLKAQGMQYLQGPFNLSINAESGLLVEGFDTAPSVMMGHTPPYYVSQLEALGYAPAKDLLAYRIRSDFAVPAAMQTLTSKTTSRIRLRPLRRSALRTDLATLRDIFNDAWSKNWGFVPFTEAEFTEVGQNLSRLLDDDFIQIAEVEDVPAGMIVVLPNINEVIRDLNGRLLPLGWLKLLWRLKRTPPKTARIPLMGVRKRYQQSLLGTALTFLLIDAVRAPVIRRGIEEVELSWILEDNLSMRNIIESLGGLCCKRYRIYQKKI
jgi:hypothetical protein